MLSIECWLTGGSRISLRHCLPKVGRWAMNLNALPSLAGLVFGRPDGGSTSMGRGVASLMERLNPLKRYFHLWKNLIKK